MGEDCVEESLTYSCGARTLLLETPCNNTCPVGSFLHRGSCTTTFYSCAGRSQEAGQPCGGTCLSPDYCLAAGVCQELEDRDLWSCSGGCDDLQPRQQPCDGVCPPGRIKLEDHCVNITDIFYSHIRLQRGGFETSFIADYEDEDLSYDQFDQYDQYDQYSEYDQHYDQYNSSYEDSGDGEARPDLVVVVYSDLAGCLRDCNSSDSSDSIVDSQVCTNWCRTQHCPNNCDLTETGVVCSAQFSSPDQACQGTCHQGYVRLSSGHCAITSQTYSCGLQTLPLHQPCNDQCPPHRVLHQGKCVEVTYLCRGRTQSAEIPCDGRCPDTLNQQFRLDNGTLLR